MGYNRFGLEPYKALKKHPNYEPEKPIEGDTIITFTLRYVANLISPEQGDEESYDIECTEIKQALQSKYIARDITNIWLNQRIKTDKYEY